MSFKEGFHRGAGEATGKVVVWAIVAVLVLGGGGIGGYYAFRWAKDGAKEVVMAPVNAAKDAAGAVKDKAADIGGKAVEKISNAKDAVVDKTTQATEAVAEKVSAAKDVVVDKSHKAAEKVGDAYEASKDKVKSWWHKDDPPADPAKQE